MAKTKKKGGYRSRESYIAKDPEKRARQLANLGRGRRKTKAEMAAMPSSQVERYKENIIDFAEYCFYLTETRKPIVLLDWQKDLLADLFGKQEQDRPSLAVLGMVKKAGKSTLAALIAVWFMVNKPDAEIYILGPDRDQGQLVVFRKIQQACRLHPALKSDCVIRGDSVVYEPTGATIRVLACSTTNAGLNPDLTILDESWQFSTTEQKRTVDEMTTPPGKYSLTLTTTYAGFSSDDDSILWGWYKRGRDIESGAFPPDPKFYFYWRTDYDGIPWVSDSYLAAQRGRLRENSYRRFHCNEWTSAEEAFIEPDVLAECVDKTLQRGSSEATRPSVAVGLDVGLKWDCSALVAVRQEGGRVVLTDHALFQPVGGKTLDMGSTIEATLRVWAMTYDVAAVFFDPYQCQRTAAIMRNEGIRMIEYPQTTGNLCRMSETLHGLLNNREIVLYDDPEVLQHLLNAQARESDRGYRITKRRESQKIDGAIAMAMACQCGQENFLMRRAVGFSFIDLDPDEFDDEVMWHNIGCL